MSNTTRKKLERQAANEHINFRDSLFGGRTEAFKSQYKCDEYPVGFKQFYNPIIEEILDESFIGVVNCDVIPPKTYMYLYYKKAKTEHYYFI